MINIHILLPEITMAICMVIVFTTGLFISNRLLISLMGIGSAFIVFYLLHAVSNGIAFNGMFRIDGLSYAFKSVCLLAMSMALLLSVDYKRIGNRNYSEYCSLIMLSTVAMMLMASAGDMLIVYLSLELMSLCIYALTGFTKEDPMSNEAALKYFLLGTLGAMLLLFSIALVYGTTGATDFQKIALYVKEKGLAGNPFLLLALAFSVAAFAFKIAAVPFHQWSPDAYEGAPTTVTAFMSVGPKAAAFAAFGRLFYEGFMPLQINWAELLIVLSVLTMAVGNIIAMAQNNIKRMLAYSSIAHAGYMLLGFASGSQEGIEAVSFYMLIYAFMNMGAFAIVVYVNKGEDIDSYRGLWHRHPMIASAMLVFMASLAGLPPTAGFAGKLNLFMAAIQSGYVLPVIFAVIFSILSAYYYLRIVVLMFFATSSEHTMTAHSSSAPINIAIAITVFFVCLIGIWPAAIL